MRVIHVVPDIAQEASGPSYSVPRLCESLIEEGAEVELVALEKPSPHRPLPFLRTFPPGIGPARLGASPAMRRWLDEQAASGRVDILHNHSLWMMPNVYPGHACRQRRCRLVVSPRGTLAARALRRSSWRKKVFWQCFQAQALREAVAFHATATSEYEDIRRRGFRQPVVILPNGVDVPPLQAKAAAGPRQLLYLGRIHPIKGIEDLLRAWQVLSRRFPDWSLRIVGPANGEYPARMQRMAAQWRLDRIAFSGPAYGEDKLEAYRRASLYVLPTRSESFGMTVAEALAAGTPAVVTQGAPWQGLADHGAGWWIETGLDALVACLEHALSLPAQELARMGQAGHAWMQREHAWRRIGERMLATYHWLLGSGTAPDWVRTD